MQEGEKTAICAFIWEVEINLISLVNLRLSLFFISILYLPINFPSNRRVTKSVKKGGFHRPCNDYESELEASQL